MCELKEQYTNTEWQEREMHYIEAIQNMVIPLEPSPQAIVALESEIDRILSEALIEQAYLRRRSDKANQDRKLSERELHFQIKTSPTYSNSKLTTGDVDSLIATHLKANPLPGYSRDIYTIVNAISYRLTFIEEVVRTLSEKKSSLMIISSMMKIESRM